MKRLKKYLIRGSIALGALLAILMILNAILISVYSGRLEERIGAIQATGDPVSLPELAPAPVPPEQNAAVFLDRARSDVEAMIKELDAVFDNEDLYDGLISEADLETIESVFKAYPNVIGLLRQAAECSGYDPQRDFTAGPDNYLADNLPRIQETRSVIRLLGIHVHLLVFRDEREKALEDCITIFRLTRHFEREPTLIGYLISVACRHTGVVVANAVLRTGKLPDASYKTLEEELALYDGTEAYVHSLKSERVFGIENYHSIINQMGRWPVQAYFLDDECDYLDLITEQLELAARPYSELVAADIENKYQGKIGTMAQLVLPALLQGRKASDRIKAQVRCLRVLNVLTVQDDLTDPKPDQLGLPADAVTDPFSGELLRIKNTTDGWVVYSPGANLKDDGGDFSELRDVGLGPILKSEKGDE